MKNEKPKNKTKVPKSTNKKVVQKNELIQKGHNDLSYNDLLLLKTIISKINSKSSLFLDNYTITTKDLEVTGFTQDKSLHRRILVKSLEKLASTYVIIENENETIQVGLISNKFTYPKYKSEIKIQIHEDLAPYLLQIKERFTKYPLEVLSLFKTKYQINFYEYCKSIESLRQQKISIDKLKEIMGIDKEKYKRPSLFKKDVLNKTIKAINQSDITVEYKDIKDKHRITGFLFTINGQEKFSLKSYIESKIGQQLNVNGEKIKITEIIEKQNNFRTLYRLKVESSLGLKGEIPNDFEIDELKSFIETYNIQP